MDTIFANRLAYSECREYIANLTGMYNLVHSPSRHGLRLLVSRSTVS